MNQMRDGMLVLTRREGDRLMIGRTIVVEVVETFSTKGPSRHLRPRGRPHPPRGKDRTRFFPGTVFDISQTEESAAEIAEEEGVA